MTRSHRCKAEWVAVHGAFCTLNPVHPHMHQCVNNVGHREVIYRKSDGVVFAQVHKCTCGHRYQGDSRFV